MRVGACAVSGAGISFVPLQGRPIPLTWALNPALFRRQRYDTHRKFDRKGVPQAGAFGELARQETLLRTNQHLRHLQTPEYRHRDVTAHLGGPASRLLPVLPLLSRKRDIGRSNTARTRRKEPERRFRTSIKSTFASIFLDTQPSDDSTRPINFVSANHKKPKRHETIQTLSADVRCSSQSVQLRLVQGRRR